MHHNTWCTRWLMEIWWSHVRMPHHPRWHRSHKLKHPSTRRTLVKGVMPKKAASRLPAAQGKPPELTQAQLAAVEAKIEHSILSKIPPAGDAPMDSAEPRIAALEAQVLELKQSQLLQCVDQQKQVSAKMDNLQQQVESQATTFQSCLEQQMSEQMKRIESLLNKRKAQEWHHVFAGRCSDLQFCVQQSSSIVVLLGVFWLHISHRWSPKPRATKFPLR